MRLLLSCITVSASIFLTAPNAHAFEIGFSWEGLKLCNISGRLWASVLNKLVHSALLQKDGINDLSSARSQFLAVIDNIEIMK